MTGSRIGAWALGIAALAATACGPEPLTHDTGYRGTWSRSGDRNVSIVALTDMDGSWRFRWTKRNFDGKYTILCDWDGRCEERLNGELQAIYAIATRFDAATGKLYTETLETRLAPEASTFHYIDVMELADEGRTLWNYTVERDGRTYEGAHRPKRSFRKVSDAVADPPPVRP